MIRTITIHIDFPALDRLVTFLENNDQAAIDAATEAVKAATVNLKQSSQALSAAVQKEQ